MCGLAEIEKIEEEELQHQQSGMKKDADAVVVVQGRKPIPASSCGSVSVCGGFLLLLLFCEYEVL